jgi:hypothetical protein
VLSPIETRLASPIMVKERLTTHFLCRSGAKPAEYGWYGT